MKLQPEFVYKINDREGRSRKIKLKYIYGKCKHIINIM